MAAKAPMSIQPHIMFNRDGVRRLVNRALNGSDTPRQHNFDDQLVVENGVLYVRFLDELTWNDLNQVTYATKASIGEARRGGKRFPTSLKQVSFKAPKREANVTVPAKLASVLAGSDDMYVQELVSHVSRRKKASCDLVRTVAERVTNPEAISLLLPVLDKCDKLQPTVMRKVAFLAETSKMGCYSFNLAAGPRRKFLGACPASAFGFALLTSKEQNLEIIESEIKRPVNPDMAICNGCYGMKGNYGNPSMQVVQEVRTQIVEVMLRVNPARLAEYFTMAIRMAQLKSMQERYALELVGHGNQKFKIANPAFFRIHDVGDCFTADYLRVWSQVARNFGRPHVDQGFTFPAVQFWMPTRMWMIPAILRPALKDVPTNLILRPSAYHFGDPTPQADGYSQGAGATFITSKITEHDVAEAKKVVGDLRLEQQRSFKRNGSGAGQGFICPAYLPGKLGGGGTVGGNCAAATGLAGQLPEPRGPGCRVCWLNPDVRVVYPEH